MISIGLRRPGARLARPGSPGSGTMTPRRRFGRNTNAHYARCAAAACPMIRLHIIAATARYFRADIISRTDEIRGASSACLARRHLPRGSLAAERCVNEASRPAPVDKNFIPGR